MKKNLLEFLYGVSQQEAEVDSVLDEDFAALLERADAEEAEAMQAEKSPLSAALKTIGITGEALHEDPDGFCLITDDRDTYVEACRKLSEPENMHTLAVKGWVATHGGDQAMSNEAPEFKIKFLEITTTSGDGEENKESGESETAIVKAGREFATEEPDHDDDLSPVDHDAPDGNKLKKVTIGKATDGAKPKGAIKDSLEEGFVKNLVNKITGKKDSPADQLFDRFKADPKYRKAIKSGAISRIKAKKDEIKDSLSASDIVDSLLECKPGGLKQPKEGGKVPHAFKNTGKKKK